MTEPSDVRLAVLIDADNVSASHAAALLAELARYGVPTVKRAYGDWTTQQLTGWKGELARHAIRPIQQFANTIGKNSTDSALIIDAMDLLYSGNLDAFAIVSSDSDFTRLATRVRESGKTVYGLGRRRTPASLQAACDKFIFLEVLRDEADQAQGKDAGADRRADHAADHEDDAEAEADSLPDLRTILEAAVRSTAQDDGWSALGSVGSYLGKTHAAFDPRHYGFPRLSALAGAQSYLDLDHPDGGQPRVRLRSQRPPRKRAAASKGAPKQAPEEEPAENVAKKTAKKTARTRKGAAAPGSAAE
ncbi:NYN domain-containing protein [Nocardioides sp.]|uniref:NYN domain-containing protein n=1 Tax=Nocardioides sp. TaxID=35761 RepID=UPI002604B227|nr:NYN domain-containing protein [Nocardioides sp.]MDI6912349.1 NYN domain-containing protein [Nocardioides sp.]